MIDDVERTVAEFDLPPVLAADVTDSVKSLVAHTDDRKGFNFHGLSGRFYPNLPDDVYPISTLPQLASGERRSGYSIEFGPYVVKRMGKQATLSMLCIARSSDQLSIAMLQAMRATTSFVIAVESDMIERPDAIVGDTNPVMAKFAGRVGLHTVWSYQDYDVPVNDSTITDDEIAATVQTTREQRAFPDQINTDNGRLERMLKVAKILKGRSHVEGDEVDEDARQIANFVLELAGMADEIYVFSGYETFKQGVISYLDKYPLIANRVLRSLQLTKMDHQDRLLILKKLGLHRLRLRD